MNFLDNIKNKINKKINPENLILIDNSHLHISSSFFRVKISPEIFSMKIMENW